jgi:Tol biopolymer transport system component
LRNWSSRSGTAADRQLVWFSRDGKRLGSFGSPGEYSSPSLSPDQRKVAIARAHAQIRTPDIWILDLVRGTETRFTFDPGGEITPLWSADGRRIVFASELKALLLQYKVLFVLPAWAPSPDGIREVKKLDLHSASTLTAFAIDRGLVSSDASANSRTLVRDKDRETQ